MATRWSRMARLLGRQARFAACYRHAIEHKTTFSLIPQIRHEYRHGSGEKQDLAEKFPSTCSIEVDEGFAH
jgi:hypothetical protein